MRDSLVEIWQANASGPLSPSRRPPRRAARSELPRPAAARSPTTRARYRFVTIKPGSYPWQNHPFAWRPAAHPLLAARQRAGAAADHADVLPRRSAARDRPDLPERSRCDGARTPASAASTSRRGIEMIALGYRFDIVLRGREVHAAWGSDDGRRARPRRPSVRSSTRRCAGATAARSRSPGARGERIVLDGPHVRRRGAPSATRWWRPGRPPQGCAPEPAPARSNPYGFGRVETAEDGTVPHRDRRCPAGRTRRHINVTIFARGLLKPLRTRVYLARASAARADPGAEAARRLAAAAHADRHAATGGVRVPLGRPPAGRRRNRLLRDLTRDGRQPRRRARSPGPAFETAFDRASFARAMLAFEAALAQARRPTRASSRGEPRAPSRAACDRCARRSERSSPKASAPPRSPCRW